MKKVLIVHIAHWDQLLGGAELQLKYLSDFFVDNNYEAHFVFLNRNKKETKTTSVIEHPLKFKRLFGTLGKYWFIYKKHIRKKVKKISPDILITRTYSSWSGIVSQIAQEEKIKHFHFIASDNDVVRSKDAIPRIKIFDRIELFFASKVFNSHTQIIVQNKFQKEEIKKRFNVELRVLTQVAPINNIFKVKKSKEKLIIVWVANFKPLKRPEKFLEIVKHFKNSKKIEFVMIGSYYDETYRKMLNEYSKINNFTYLGALKNDEVNDVLDTSHILVNTSDYEGFSNTFTQAWMRKNIVISLNSNPDYILTKYEVGFLTKTIGQTIEKLSFLLENKTEISKMGNLARNYAVKNHSIKNIYKYLMNF